MRCEFARTLSKNVAEENLVAALSQTREDIEAAVEEDWEIEDYQENGFKATWDGMDMSHMLRLLG